MIEIGANHCVKRRVLERESEIWVLLPTQAKMENRALQKILSPTRKNVWDPILGTLDFSNTVFPFLKAIQPQRNQAGICSLFFCSMLTSLSQEGKVEECSPTGLSKGLEIGLQNECAEVSEK